MKALCFNGWGQIFDSLGIIVPKEINEVSHIKYSKHSNYKNLKEEILDNKTSAEIVIGWSLGGQLAVRLVSDGALKPKLLVLLAAPFQFVADKNVPSGMNSLAFLAFKNAFSLIPTSTLKRFALMIGHNDSNMKKIVEDIGIDQENIVAWNKWLDEIKDFSCQKFDFKNFPRTLIIHGDGDTVVNVQQGKLFNEKIKNSRLEIIQLSGHAPHLHDAEFVKKVIKEEIQKI